MIKNDTNFMILLYTDLMPCDFVVHIRGTYEGRTFQEDDFSFDFGEGMGILIVFC